jgi:hypothetical protein
VGGIISLSYGDNDVTQTEIHTAEPLVPEPSAFEVEMAIEKLKRYKSPGTYHIPAELIKTGGRTICCEIHKLHKRINSVWNKEKLLEQGKSQSLYLFISRVIKQIAITIAAYHFCQLHTKFYQTSFCKG